jgi:SAM-dependent methyltransferase
VDSFYVDFEARFYAPREVIKELRKQYLAFVEPLINLYPQSKAFDVGCGRGEWLELMQEKGLSPYGVDLDEGMLAQCTALNLPAEKGDAIEYMSSLTESSQLIVSSFHVVEHISSEKLKDLVAQAYRVLMPGGLLILETPNPENILVATKNFHLDPTHINPIPSEYLAFLAEYYGFEKVKMVRLQEDKNLIANSELSLLDVINGVSPDYAIVAQKKGDDCAMEAVENPFAIEYGVSLDILASTYNQQINNKIKVISEKTEQAEAKAEQAEAKAEQAEAKAEQAEAKAEQAIAELNLIYISTSWRITAPLRKLMLMFKAIFRLTHKTLRRFYLMQKGARRRLLLKSIVEVSRHPVLKRRSIIFVKKFPALYDRLRLFVDVQRSEAVRKDQAHDLVELTPRGIQILAELKTCIDSQVKRSR